MGIDLVEIGRIRRAHGRWGNRFLRRIFTAEELAHCLRKKNPYPSLAARFAAKEAVAKALSTGFGRDLAFRSISIANGPSGEPRVVLADSAAARARGGRVLISLSHTATQAIAQALLIGGDGGPDRPPTRD
jgi:holo-[acyl-carrier protein] synthase